MRRRLPPLRAIVCFEAVAEQESLVGGARQLGVTKGAVSQQIRQLEEFLGIELFSRDAGRMRLTEPGRRYYAAVRASLETLETATLQLSRSPARKSLRLTVLPAFASMWLAQRLADFQSAHPDIDIDLSADPTMVDFSRSDAHLGIRFSGWPAAGRKSGSDADLMQFELLRDALFPVCSPAYRDKMRITEPGDMARCRLLHDNYWHDDWPRWSERHNVALPNRQEGQYFTHYSVAIDAARSGGGVAMGHGLLVHDILLRGDLVRLFDVSVPAREPYVLVKPERVAHLGFVSAFEAWIKTRLAEDVQAIAVRTSPPTGITGWTGT